MSQVHNKKSGGQEEVDDVITRRLATASGHMTCHHLTSVFNIRQCVYFYTVTFITPTSWPSSEAIQCRVSRVIRYAETEKTACVCVYLTRCRCYHELPHAYVDDTQIYGHCQPSDAGSLTQQVSVCIDEISAWMKANRLQLNPSKTEVLWCASSRRQHQIPTGPVRVGDALVSPVTAARDLGV